MLDLKQVDHNKQIVAVLSISLPPFSWELVSSQCLCPVIVWPPTIGRGYLGLNIVQHVLGVVLHGMVGNLRAAITIADWWMDGSPRPGSHERRW